MSAADPSVRATASTARPAASPISWLQRPVVAGLVLLAAYVALSLLMDPSGSLGTDTGGKVATLEVMRDGGLDPDVGWWAAAEDPDAELHGLYYTWPVGDRYVNVSTLPMVLVASPLYDLGGYRAALVVPMAGAVAAAFAARAIAGRTGASRRASWWAYWLVGLASPITIYALDLWEHTWGAALMAWGAVWLVDAAALAWARPEGGEGGGELPAPSVPVGAVGLRAGAAGLAFGLAFGMRTEALAYGFTFTAVTCVAVLLVRRDLVAPVVVGVGSALGLVVGIAANLGLEVAVLGESMRSGRATGAAANGGFALGTRLEEGVITTVNLDPDSTAASLVAGLVLASALGYLAWATSRRGPRTVARGVAAVLVVLVVLRLAQGPGFVPGLVATTPFAAVGAVLAWPVRTARILAAAALGALPLVWVFQFIGGALPQWGGRYVLTSGLVLAAVGIGQSTRMDRWARRLVVGCAVAVTALGLVWMVERTHEVGDAARHVAARQDPVLISDVAFWLRELGVAYPGTQWLSVDSPDKLDRAVAIADGRTDRLALLQLDDDAGPPERLGPFVAVDEEELVWLGTPFRITTYERAG